MPSLAMFLSTVFFKYFEIRRGRNAPEEHKLVKNYHLYTNS